MRKAFENIKIEKPIFDGSTLKFKLINNINPDDLAWSVDSESMENKIDRNSWKKLDDYLIIDCANEILEPNVIYHLIGKKDNLPVRFTFENVESYYPFEVHHNMGVNPDTELIRDIYVNPFGNIDFREISKVGYGNDVRLPIISEVSKISIDNNDMIFELVINYNKDSLDIESIRPVLIKVASERTEYSRIHDYSIEKSNGEIKIVVDIKSVNNLEFDQNYSFGIMYDSKESSFTSLVNRVSQEVFSKVHPYSGTEFIFKNQEVVIDWFDNEGVILRRVKNDNDLLKKEKLRFNANLQFKTISSEAGKLELEQQFKDFNQKWIEESPYRILGEFK